MHKDGVKEKVQEVYDKLNKKYRMELDLREQYSPGYKFNDYYGKQCTFSNNIYK